MSDPTQPSEPGTTPDAPDSGLGREAGLGKGLQLALGAVIVAALLGWYGWTNLQQGASFQYFQSLDEFMAQAPPSADVGLRLHGYVANTSIERDLEGKEVRFRVQSDPPHSAGDADQTPPADHNAASHQHARRHTCAHCYAKARFHHLPGLLCLHYRRQLHDHQLDRQQRQRRLF